MSLLARLAARSPEAREFKSSIPPNSAGFASDAGEYVSDRTALRLAAVHACVRLLADSIASLPLDAYRRSDGIRQEVNPTPPLVRQPFAGMNNFEGMFQVVTSLAMRGESVSLITQRDALEFPTAGSLLPLHPDAWMVEPDRDTGKPVYRVAASSKRLKRVDTADIVHIKRFSLPGSLHGISPINEARQAIGLGLAAERYGARWFGESADPSAVLESDQDMTSEQVKRNQLEWLQSRGGKRHPAVMSGGLKYKRISITPEESQFLETRRFQRSEIAMLFGIPPHMIGDVERSTSWGTGIEQQSIGWVRFGLRAWLTCIESAYSSLLPRGQFVRFTIDALLRGDTKSRYESYVQARNAGWLNVNEIRELEDRPPVDGGDEYLQPLNMGPLGSDPLAAKAGAPPEEGSPDE